MTLKTFQTMSEILLTDEQKEEFEEGLTSTIEILREGEFLHPSYGTLKFDKKIFKTMIKNFKENVLGRDLSYDIAHEPDLGATAWVKEIFIDKRDIDGNETTVLKAVVEWTKLGWEKAKDKIFQYFSTEYNHNYIDRETGEEYGHTILGGGLTNRPFISKLQPIALSEDGEAVEYIDLQDILEMEPGTCEVIKFNDEIDLPNMYIYLRGMTYVGGKEKHCHAYTAEIMGIKVKGITLATSEGNPHPHAIDTDIFKLTTAVSGEDEHDHHVNLQGLSLKNSKTGDEILLSDIILDAFNEKSKSDIPLEGNKGDKDKPKPDKKFKEKDPVVQSKNGIFSTIKGEKGKMDLKELKAKIDKLAKKLSSEDIGEKDKVEWEKEKNELQGKFDTALKELGIETTKMEDKEEPKKEEPKKEEPKKEDDSRLQKELSDMKVSDKAKDDAIKTLSNEVTTLNAQNKETHRRFIAGEKQAYVKSLSSDGHYPAVVKVVESIIMSDTINYEDNIVTLSETVGEGEEKKTVEIGYTLSSIIKKVLDSIPKELRVDLSDITVYDEPDKDVFELDMEAVRNGIKKRGALVASESKSNGNNN